MDGRPVLPEHDVVVVDEAHELVDRVTGVATAELTAGAVDRGGAALGKLARPGHGRSPRRGGRGPRRWCSTDLPTGPVGGAPPARVGGAVGRSAMRRAPCRSRLGSERREDADGAAGRKVAQAALDEVIDTTTRLLKAVRRAGPGDGGYDVVWLAEQGADRHELLCAPRRCGSAGCCGSGCSGAAPWCSPRPR